MAPNKTPIPMPTLADLERPKDDAEKETGADVPGLVAVAVALFDASAVDAELVVDADDLSTVFDLWESDAVDVEALNVPIEIVPSFKRLEDSPQQPSPLSFAQHQLSEDNNGHAMMLVPPCGFSMIA